MMNNGLVATFGSEPMFKEDQERYSDDNHVTVVAPVNRMGYS